MLFYISTIIISVVIIILANLFSAPFDLNNLLWLSVNTVIGTVGVITLDGIGALIVRRLLPMKWFTPEKKLFQVSKKEHKFYNKIKIKSWKDKVPELGGFTNFSKSEFKSPGDKEYLKRFIIESNYGVICHLQNAICGFLIMFIPHWFGNTFYIFPALPSIWIPIFAVNFVLSMLPVFILRYTNYTLIRLYNKQEKKQLFNK